MLWSFSFGGSEDELSSALSLDATGSALYLTGSFFSEAVTVPDRSQRFGPSASAVTLLNHRTSSAPLTYSQNSQGFVLKLNASDGALLWALSGGGTGNDYATGVNQPRVTGGGGRGVVLVSGTYNSPSLEWGESWVLPAQALSGGSGDGFVLGVDETDDCASNPCRNGGTCIESVALPSLRPLSLPSPPSAIIVLSVGVWCGV